MGYVDLLNIQKPMLIHHSKQTKEKPHDHFSTCKEIFDKIPYPFLIFKTVSKLEREGDFFELIKGIKEKHTANIILNSMNAFLLRSVTKQECTVFSSNKARKTK